MRNEISEAKRSCTLALSPPTLARGPHDFKSASAIFDALEKEFPEVRLSSSLRNIAFRPRAATAPGHSEGIGRVRRLHHRSLVGCHIERLMLRAQTEHTWPPSRPERASLPVVTAEIGDTWIYGASTDPVKVRGRSVPSCSVRSCGRWVGDVLRSPSSALRNATDTRMYPCALATPMLTFARTAMPVSKRESERVHLFVAVLTHAVVPEGRVSAEPYMQVGDEAHHAGSNVGRAVSGRALLPHAPHVSCASSLPSLRRISTAC